MSSMIGKNLKVSLFGQSHSEAIGVVLDGLPPGFALDFDRIGQFMARRAPGSSRLTTRRKESDLPTVLSGLVDGRTCGAPLCAIINNEDVRSGDYAQHHEIPRPSHSDYPAFVKYHGFNDIRGGGHFSGRLTAPLCFAGAVCIQILESYGIHVGAHLYSVGTVRDTPFDASAVSAEQLKAVSAKALPVLDDQSGLKMASLIELAFSETDSVGGIVEFAAVGLPCGLGDPMFDGTENRLAAAIFGIPAVRGIEFGSGFEAAAMRGSQHNDPYYYRDGVVSTRTNHHGGILGGITTGQPLLFRVAFKPTSSIAVEQDSVNLKTREDCKLRIKGRHDPCIAIRAVPCVESAAAITLLDLLTDFHKEEAP